MQNTQCGVNDELNHCTLSPSQRSTKGATKNGVTYEGVAEFLHLGTLISNDNIVEKKYKDVSWPTIELISQL
jgi:hypothetical protein